MPASLTDFGACAIFPDIEDLADLTAAWATENVAVAVATDREVLATGGDGSWRTRIASVAKLLAAYAALVALEEGTIDLDEPAGPPGATVRHLLAHTAGYGFNDPTVLAAPGTRRIYSNVGIEAFADHLDERSGMAFGEYLALAVLDPLGLSDTVLTGSPAHGVVSSVNDLVRFGQELLAPTLIAPTTLALATTSQFPDVPGVLPGFGPQNPNPWGLGFELRGEKSPHWTAPGNSPLTFGHFGGAGTFLWVDPVVGLVCVCLTDREFGPWAAQVWPEFSQAVINRFG